MEMTTLVLTSILQTQQRFTFRSRPSPGAVRTNKPRQGFFILPVLTLFYWTFSSYSVDVFLLESKMIPLEKPFSRRDFILLLFEDLRSHSLLSWRVTEWFGSETAAI